MVQKAPAIINFADKMNFSYQINAEYPNSIAFSRVQSSTLMAYASSNLIVVLCDCKFLNAILEGHKGTVVCVAFEMCGPNLIAADIYGNFYFWHHSDGEYKISRIIEFGIFSTCISWYPAKRAICISTKKGLFYGNIIDFCETNCQKLLEHSTFCSFNSEGSMIASHNSKTIVTIFILSSEPISYTKVKHFRPVIMIEFHPYLPIFISITNDFTLHIWRLNKFSTFTCATRIKVNGLCRFIQYPAFFTKYFQVNKKPSKIAYLNESNQIVSFEINDYGQIKSQNQIQIPKTRTDMYLLAIIKTNAGLEATVIHENELFITSKHRTRRFLYHMANIKEISFQEKTDWILTRDEQNCLIAWPITNPNYSPALISRTAIAASWLDDKYLLFLSDKKLIKYNQLTSEKEEFPFPELNNCVSICVLQHSSIFALTKTRIISNTHHIDIPQFTLFSFSNSDTSDYFHLILLIDNSQQFTAYILPDYKKINCAKRTSHVEIKNLTSISLISFTALTNESIEVWNYTNELFELTTVLNLPGLNFLEYAGSMLFTADEKTVYGISNSVFPVMKNVNITKMAVNQNGCIAYVTGKSFSVLPFPWRFDSEEKAIKNDANRDFMVTNFSEDTLRLMKMTKRHPINFMISSFDYVSPQSKSFNIIHSTLFHLLEYESLIDFVPRQIPSIPDQCAFPLEFPNQLLPSSLNNQDIMPTAINLNDSGNTNNSNGRNDLLKNSNDDKSMDSIDTNVFNFRGKNYLELIPPDERDRVDLFGLRYLYAVKESLIPASYFAHWLSFSFYQNEVVDIITDIIKTNNLSRLFISVSLSSHQKLVDIVKIAIQNNWNQFHVVQNVALFLVALGNQQQVAKLYYRIGDNQRGDFFSYDFTIPRFKKRALKNAYSSLSHTNYEISAALFILADQINVGIKVILDKLRDPILAFLTVRLLTNSNYDSDLMKWFLALVKWDDDIIPILIAKLTNSNDITSLLEDALLVLDPIKNISSFGDRRIALFQIYQYLIKKMSDQEDFVRLQNVLHQVARNLCYDGLAPLANFLFEFSESPYTTIRSIPSIHDKTEVSDDENIQLTPMQAFDFGETLHNLQFDDFDSYEEDDDDNNQNLEEGNDMKQLKVSQDFFGSTIRKYCVSLTRLFSIYTNKKYINSISIQNQVDKDNEAALLAVQCGHIEIATHLFTQEQIHQLEVSISHLIQTCSVDYFFSAHIPSEPMNLLNLSKQLLRLTTQQDNIPFHINSLLQSDKDGFSCYAFLGAFIVALWTYNHPLLYNLHLPTNDLVQLNLNQSYQKQSLFGIDLFEPRFPDTMPDLLSQYLKDNIQDSYETSLERCRVLIMYLIYSAMLDQLHELFSKTNENQNMYNELFSILDRRKESILKILKFYQIVLNCPSLQPPSINKNSIKTTEDQLSYIMLINEQHQKEMSNFDLIQNSAFPKLNNQIFRSGRFCIEDSHGKINVNDNVIDMISVPLDQQSIILISTNSIYSMNLKTQSVKLELSLKSYFLNRIISHPFYNLALVFSNYGASLYNFSVGQSYYTNYTYRGVNETKITAAAFSPTGKKVVICSIFVEIYLFDVTLAAPHRCLIMFLNGIANSIVWSNTDTSLIVSYTTRNGSQKLAQINTVTSDLLSIPINHNIYGIINVMQIDRFREYLAYGTKNGKAIILDVYNNYSAIFIHCFPKAEVLSIAISNDLIAFGSSEGELILLNSDNFNQMTIINVKFPIVSIVILNDKILLAGNKKSIELLKSQK